MIKNREIDLVLNTPYGKQEREDDSSIRAAATSAGIPCVTTMAGISAVVSALSALGRGEFGHAGGRRDAQPDWAAGRGAARVALAPPAGLRRSGQPGAKWARRSIRARL